MEAIILHRAPYGEADRILEMMTREIGKIAVIAKHAGKSRKRFGQVLDYFNILDISARQGKGGLAFLEEASLVETYPELRLDMERLHLAFDLLEMMRAAVHEGQPEPEKYQLLKDSLDFVSHLPSTAALKAAFQLRLLVLAGVGPNFSECCECGRRHGSELQGEWRLMWGRGGLVCRACSHTIPPGEIGFSLSELALVWMEAASRLGPNVLRDIAPHPPEVIRAAEQCIQYYLR